MSVDIQSIIQKTAIEYFGSRAMASQGVDPSQFAEAIANTAGQALQIQSQQPASWDPSILTKAIQDADFEDASNSNAKGIFVHPHSEFFGVSAAGDANNSYRENPNKLSYEVLRAMAYQTTIIAAIINTRINQVASFARPPKNEFSTGFKIRPRDPEHKASKAERKHIQELEKYISYTGFTKNPATRDNFEMFLRKFVRDSLIFDQAVAQVVPQNQGNRFIPSEFVAMDASTFRIAQIRNPNEDVLENGFVQILDGEIVETFDRNEIIWGVRNPRTDIRVAGYGLSELEQLVTVVTSILFSEEYNRRVFQSGSTPKGMIFVQPPPGVAGPGIQAFQEQLNAFRQQWWAQVSGVQNAWRVPILSGPQLQWIDLERGNRDMEWSQYHEMLIKLASSVFQIDPAEINWDIKSMSSAPSSLNQSSSEYNIKYSKDKGMGALLHFLEDHINQSLLWPIEDNYVLDFVGLDQTTEKDVIDLLTREVTSYKTLNEARTQRNLKPLENGDFILNGIYTSKLMQDQQAEQQNQQGGQPMPGEGEQFPEWDAGEDSDIDEEPDEEEGSAKEGKQPPKKSKPKKPVLQKSQGPIRKAKTQLAGLKWKLPPTIH